MTKIPDHLVFVDTETTGLDLDEHDIWEIAFTVGDSPMITVKQVEHTLRNADPKALELNGYRVRALHRSMWNVDDDLFIASELTGKTLVGANPAFDAYRLEKRWGRAPWHYRLIDVESMAVPILGLNKPLGLRGLVDKLTHMGYTVPRNNHTAADDVTATREVYRTLQSIGQRMRGM